MAQCVDAEAETAGEFLLRHAEARADGAHVDPLRDMHAVGAKVGLALGVGDRLLQTAADAVGAGDRSANKVRVTLDFIHKVLIMFLSVECLSIGSMFDIVDQNSPAAFPSRMPKSPSLSTGGTPSTRRPTQNTIALNFEFSRWTLPP